MGNSQKKQKAIAQAIQNKFIEDSKQEEVKQGKETSSETRNFEKAIDTMKRSKALRAEIDESITMKSELCRLSSELLSDSIRPDTLTELDLRAKKLDVLSLRNFIFQDLLPKAVNLTRVSIINSRLSDFPTPLPRSLIELTLSKNLISVIDQQALRPLTDLEVLDLGSNSLTSVCKLVSLKKLTYLNMSRNSIDFIQTQAFQGLECLKEINLSMNNIKDLNFTLGDVPSLEVLLLTRNMINSLSDDFCNPTNSLRVLRLNQNTLEYLPENIGNLKSLYKLDVRSTKLKRLPMSLKDCVELKKFSTDRTNPNEIPKSVYIAGIDAIKEWMQNEESKKTKVEQKVLSDIGKVSSEVVQKLGQAQNIPQITFPIVPNPVINEVKPNDSGEEEGEQREEAKLSVANIFFKNLGSQAKRKIEHEDPFVTNIKDFINNLKKGYIEPKAHSGKSIIAAANLPVKNADQELAEAESKQANEGSKVEEARGRLFGEGRRLNETEIKQIEKERQKQEAKNTKQAQEQQRIKDEQAMIALERKNIGIELDSLNNDEPNLTRRILTLSSLEASVESYINDPMHPENSSLVSTSPYFVGRIGIYQSATKLLTYAGFCLKDYHSRGLMYEMPKSDKTLKKAERFLKIIKDYKKLIQELYADQQLRTDY